MVISNPTVVELFAGAGGLSYGLCEAGFNIVLANEIDEQCAATFRANHPETTILTGDIHKINFKEALKQLDLSDIDLLSGGPPCQGFSTVGSKKKNDPRNNLFREYLRAVEEINPQFILFENVSGFKRMYNGVIYEEFLYSLDQLDYKTNSTVLEASDFGLPQNRQRTIIIGWKKNLPPVHLPTPTHSDIPGLFQLRKKVSLWEAISDLPEISTGKYASQYQHEPINDYQKKMRKNTTILTEHNAANYGEKMQEILKLIPQGGTVDDLPHRLRPKKYFKNTYARLLPDVPSPTITRNFGTPSSSRCIHPYQNRALSTREGARLQGFPDDYQFAGTKTSKNLQIGNAVPPVLGEIVGRKIMKSLTDFRISGNTLSNENSKRNIKHHITAAVVTK